MLSTTPIAPAAINGSRGKNALGLFGCAAFVALGLFLMSLGRIPEVVTGVITLLFFGLGLFVFSWLLIRPQRLRLDAEGFTLDGGFVRSPKLTRWQDVSPFFVLKLPRGGSMVAHDFTVDRSSSALVRMNRPFGAEGGLPMGWSLAPQEMVDLLNDYRSRALQEQEVLPERPVVRPS